MSVGQPACKTRRATASAIRYARRRSSSAITNEAVFVLERLVIVEVSYVMIQFSVKELFDNYTRAPCVSMKQAHHAT